MTYANSCANMIIVSVMNHEATRCYPGDAAPSYVQAIPVFDEAMRGRNSR
jgi:hypothetical protein